MHVNIYIYIYVCIYIYIYIYIYVNIKYINIDISMKYCRYMICIYVMFMHVRMDTYIVTCNAVCKHRHGCVGVVSLDVPCNILQH